MTAVTCAGGVVRTTGDVIAGDHVSGTAAANGVNGSVMLVEQSVTLQFLVEGEDGPFGLVCEVRVSRAASAIEEKCVAGRQRSSY